MKAVARAALLLALTAPAGAGLAASYTFPGGANGQVQYNHNGVFDGVPGSIVANGQVTFTAISGFPHAGWIDVTAAPYNVDPNGLLSATTGFLAAFAACPAGGTVYVPCGLYKLTGEVSTSRACNFIGEGYCTQIYQDNTSTDAFVFEGGLFGLEGVTIANMWIGSKATGTGFSDLRLNTVNSSHVANVAFSGGNRGFYVHGSLVDHFDLLKGIDAAADGNFRVTLPANTGAYFYTDTSFSPIIPESSNSNVWTLPSAEGGYTGFYGEDTQGGGGAPNIFGGVFEGGTGPEFVLRGTTGGSLHAADSEQGNVTTRISGVWLYGTRGFSVYDSSIDTFTNLSANGTSLENVSLSNDPVVSTDSVNWSEKNVQHRFTADVVPLCMGGRFGSGDALQPCVPNHVSFQKYPIDAPYIAGPMTISSPTRRGDGNVWTFQDLAHFGDFAEDVGVIAVQTNIPMDGFHWGTIHLLGQSGGVGAMDMTISMKTTTGPGFDQYSVVNSGPLDPAVTLAVGAGGKMVVLLGNESSDWVVPSLYVDSYLDTGSPTSSDGDGWSIAVVADTSTYTHQQPVANNTGVTNAQNLVAGSDGTSHVDAPLSNGAGDVRTFTNLTQLADFGADTGAVVIQTNIPMGFRFFTVHVYGYTSTDDNSAIDLTIGGASFSTPDAFREMSVLSTGKDQYPVYLGQSSDGHVAIIIGKTTSSWIVPTFAVDRAVIAGEPTRDDGAGWTMSIVTDTTPWINQFLVPDLTAVNHSSYSDTALALHDTPTKCNAGDAAQGVDVHGNALGCTTVAPASAEVSTHTLTGVLQISQGGTGNTTGQAASVAAGGVPLSTVTAAIALKQNAFTGVNVSTCPPGQFLSTMTFVNGVLVTATCVALPSAGITALTGDVIASGTGSVPATAAAVQPNITTFTQPVTDKSSHTVVGDFSANGLWTLPTSSTFTASSIAVATVTGTTITITQYANTPLFTGVVASSYPAGGGTNQMTFAIDLTTGPWELHYNMAIVTTSTGTPQLIFNGNASGSHYNWDAFDVRSGTIYRTQPDNTCWLLPTDAGHEPTFFINVTQNEFMSLTAEIETNPFRQSEINVLWRAKVYTDGYGVISQFSGTCSYRDATASNKITSIQLRLDRAAARFVGDVQLKRLGR